MKFGVLDLLFLSPRILLLVIVILLIVIIVKMAKKNK